MKELFSSDKSFRALRQKMFSLQPPCIPYLGTILTRKCLRLGLYLTDLTFIEEGGGNFIPDLVNWKKINLIYSITKEYETYTRFPFQLERDPVVAACIHNWLEATVYNENEAYYKSLALEPRKPAA